MNTKTTIYLALLLSLLVAGFLYLTRGGPQTEPEPDRRPETPGAAVARDVLNPALGDPVKIVVRRAGDEQPWEFETHEKDESGYPRWKMTSPVVMEVVRWEVERIPNTIKRAKYDLAFTPGSPGAPSDSEAGLAPPQWSVTITDSEGKSASLEVGKPRSTTETYVRRPGEKEILVATTSFNDLVRNQAIAYRTQGFWSLKPEDVRRVEIIDRTSEQPVTYVVVPDGRAGWRFEEPVSGRATDKVQSMVQTFVNMRVLRWLSDDAARLRGYGFEPAAFTLRATVEVQMPLGDDEKKNEEGNAKAVDNGSAMAVSKPAADTITPEDQAADTQTADSESTPKTRTVLKTYEFDLSNQSPLGEESKVYVRLGGTTAVGDIMKVAADKLKPSLTDWRDLRLVAVPLANPTRVALTSSGSSTAFTRREGRWFFEDGRRAEDTLVTEIVTTVANLRAVVLEDQTASTSTYGFEQPQADIRITTVDQTTPHRLVLGAYSDPQSKRLIYARFGDGPVAKLRAEDVRPLLRQPRELLDRTVFQFAPNRIERLTIERAHAITGEAERLEFERSETQWLLTHPVSAPVRQERLRELLDQLGALRGQAVLAENGQATSFGLNNPEITVTLTYKPPVESRMESKPEAGGAGGSAVENAGADNSEDSANENGAKLVSVEYQPPPQTYILRITMHDGRAVAVREDGGNVVEIPHAFRDLLLEELRSGDLFRSAADGITRLAIEGASGSYDFERREGKWTYAAEPDLPLDQAKVQNLVLQVRDLKSERFLDHAKQAHESTFSDSRLWHVELDGSDTGPEMLVVSTQIHSLNGVAAHPAVVVGRKGEFLLSQSDLARLEVRLSDLEAR